MCLPLPQLSAQHLWSDHFALSCPNCSSLGITCIVEGLSGSGQTLLDVAQAETKAAEAAARLEELLHRTTKAWLPLWLEEHYNKASFFILASCPEVVLCQ